MKTKVLYTIAGVVIIGLGVYYFLRVPAQAPSQTENQNQIAPSSSESQNADNLTSVPNQTASAQPSTPQAPASNSGGHFSDESDITGAGVNITEVDYDGTKFTPKSVNIKLGDIVVFKNKSTSAFRPASNPHPTHTDYPEFDAKEAIPAGAIYQFKFLKVGNWGYHNHLNPSIGGLVNVSK